MSDPTMFRAVFDTSVVVAALKSKNPNSPTVELLHRWRNHEFILLYADDLLLEYREKFVARKIDPALRIAFLASLSVLAERIVLSPEHIKPIIVADPDDAWCWLVLSWARLRIWFLMTRICSVWASFMQGLFS